MQIRASSPQLLYRLMYLSWNYDTSFENLEDMLEALFLPKIEIMSFQCYN